MTTLSIDQMYVSTHCLCISPANVMSRHDELARVEEAYIRILGLVSPFGRCYRYELTLSLTATSSLQTPLWRSKSTEIRFANTTHAFP